MIAVGIDSMVLIYAGLVPSKTTEQPDSKVKEFQVRSRTLILGLAQKKATVFLPTIAISEILVPVPPQQRVLLIAQLEERFVLCPFDLPAAAIAADLWCRYRQLPHDMKYPDRSVLKADAMIVASAKSAGAVEFYTTDARCRALADLVMKGKEPPAYSDDNMFLRGEVERGEAPE